MNELNVTSLKSSVISLVEMVTTGLLSRIIAGRSSKQVVSFLFLTCKYSFCALSLWFSSKYFLNLSYGFSEQISKLFVRSLFWGFNNLFHNFVVFNLFVIILIHHSFRYLKIHLFVIHSLFSISALQHE